MEMTRAVEQLFAPARRPGRIGAEVELIPVTDDPDHRPVPPSHLMSVLGGDFRRAARVSVEPGGQLELSPAPAVPEIFVPRLLSLIDRASALAAKAGLRLESWGTNPYHDCQQVPLRTPTARYLAMQDMFDQTGPGGRRMMRLTASLQVAVDLLPGQAGREQWIVANLAGPPLTAALAHSPWLDGRPAGVPGARTRIWRSIDPGRTGYEGAHLDLDDPVGAYAAFGARAPRLPISESADPTYHLNTLFAPVRPRGGYLEVRYLDAQPRRGVGDTVHQVSRLLGHAPTRRAALELLRPRADLLAEDWAAAELGTSPVAADLLALLAAGQDQAGGAA